MEKDKCRKLKLPPSRNLAPPINIWNDISSDNDEEVWHGFGDITAKNVPLRCLSKKKNNVWDEIEDMMNELKKIEESRLNRSVCKKNT